MMREVEVRVRSFSYDRSTRDVPKRIILFLWNLPERLDVRGEYDFYPSDVWFMKEGKIVGTGEGSILRNRPKGLSVTYVFSGSEEIYEKIIERIVSLVDIERGGILSKGSTVSIHESYPSFVF